MPLLTGTVTARYWRVVEKLPGNFRETVERNLQRHAFRPINVEKGDLTSMGWVNIQQLLDNELTMGKTMFGMWLVLGLRIDKLLLNQKYFRAKLKEAVQKKIDEREGRKLSKEERLVLEDKVKMDLLKQTTPNMAIYEMAWNLETGMVVFTGGGERLGMMFADLFTETFQVSIEPRMPYLRAEQWAERQGLHDELLEMLPSPFSPRQPREVVEMAVDGGAEE